VEGAFPRALASQLNGGDDISTVSCRQMTHLVFGQKEKTFHGQNLH
jgi:hypothetical protein